MLTSISKTDFCIMPKLTRILLNDNGDKVAVYIDTGYGLRMYEISTVIDYINSGNTILCASVIDNNLTICPTARNFTNLSGKKINSWYFIEYLGESYWRCQCDCNTIKSILGKTITSGKSTNCGCKRDRPKNFIDLSGRTFGLWNVQKYVGDRKWLCECECGTVRAVYTQSLTDGKSTNCGKAIHKDSFIDLSGQIIGDWTVLKYAGNKKWLCRCSCLQEREVYGAELRSLRSLSCGHVEDLTEQVFGEWTAKKYLGNSKWLCECSCGKLKEVKTQALKNRSSRSCGHVEDLTDQEFGQWKVLGYAGKQLWSCQCSCGNITDVFAGNLKSFQSLSCGRCTHPVRKQWQKEATTNQEKFNSILANACLSLNRKLTIQEVADIFNIDCRYVYILKKKYISDVYIVNAVEEASGQEDDLFTFLHTLDSEVIRHDRVLLNGKELDFLYSTKKLAIEYNGTYWHSSNYKDKDYHLNKTKQCAEKGVHLIHIFEHEWQNSRTHTILENLLRQKLTTDVQKIYARDTEIRHVSVEEYTKFLSMYHLQGSTNCTVALGLYYENELVEIMTFGTPRYNTEYDIELLRLCTKAGYIVVGGANKLFSYFVKHNACKSIISYCDLSKFTGKVYEQIGMKYNGNTSVGYSYVNLKDLTTMSRQQCTKQRLIQQGYGTQDETEEQIMHNLGYVKVYNCGNARYIYKSNKEDR